MAAINPLLYRGYYYDTETGFYYLQSRYKDAEKDGRKMRLIDSFDSPIESNEYRIALRTGKDDYHFMVQHNDGTWSHKPGFCSTRLIDGANPSVVSWDAPQINSFSLYTFGIVRDVGATSNYYDSKTVYFAVTK